MSFAGWIYPVPIWKGRVPVVSDGYQRAKSLSHRKHLGSDIMFRKIATDPAGLPSSSKHFSVPEGTPVVAVAPGIVERYGLTNRGHTVLIDHGNGKKTFYQHLANLSPSISEGSAVTAGTYLGDIGYDTGEKKYRLRHLHFEIWNPNRANTVDPGPVLRKLPMLKIDGISASLVRPEGRSQTS